MSGLDLTSRGAPQNTALRASLNGADLGETAVVDGAADVTVTLPADLASGEVVLTLTAPVSGTVVHVPLTVEAAVQPVATTTRLAALLPVHLNGLLPTTLIATVRQEDGARAEGVVVFREGEKVVATVEVKGGVATHRLGRLSRGVHAYTASFEPADPAVAAPSTSDTARVWVLF
ncbi:hypothetical protein [Microbacterium aurum]